MLALDRLLRPASCQRKEITSALQVPVGDNYYTALNSAVFSDGSFVYIPKGVHSPMELSTYFRINASNTGQFERTLIVAEEASYVSYLEGCTAPAYDENQLHAAVVELSAAQDAEIKYSTVQVCPRGAQLCFHTFRWRCGFAQDSAYLSAAAVDSVLRAVPTCRAECPQSWFGCETCAGDHLRALQNWYAGNEEGKGGIYNFVTKRGLCHGDRAKISWTQVCLRSSCRRRQMSSNAEQGTCRRRPLFWTA